MQTAITVFTPLGRPAEILHGPEALEAAKERLHAAMHNGNHAPGRIELWTARGVTESFVFRSLGEDKAPSDKDSAPDKSTVPRS